MMTPATRLPASHGNSDSHHAKGSIQATATSTSTATADHDISYIRHSIDSSALDPTAAPAAEPLFMSENTTTIEHGPTSMDMSTTEPNDSTCTLETKQQHDDQEKCAADVCVAESTVLENETIIEETPSQQQLEKMRFGLITNPNKAGTDTLISREEVQKIIYEATKDSARFQKKQQEAEKMKVEIDMLRSKASNIPPEELKGAREIVKIKAAALEESRSLDKLIVHVDMDAFYASVEELDRPELKDIPMAVGGDSENFGVLTTANYPARKYGIRSAMPTFIAYKLYPKLVLLPPDFKKYTYYAGLIREVFARYDPLFTPASLDEAYLDITNYCKEHAEQTPEEVVAEIRHGIFESTNLTASAGLAPNKMLAKVCSDRNKPNGQYIIPNNRDDIMSFLQTLPVRKVPGIGEKMEQKLKAFDVLTVGNLTFENLSIFKCIFTGNLFESLLKVSLGISETDVARKEGLPKSKARERTFKKLSSTGELYDLLFSIAKELCDDLMESNIAGRTVSLKLKQTNFHSIVRSRSYPSYVWKVDDIYSAVEDLLAKELNEDPKLEFRLIGISISNLIEKSKLESSSMKKFLQTSDNADNQEPAEEFDQVMEDDIIAEPSSKRLKSSKLHQTKLHPSTSTSCQSSLPISTVSQETTINQSKDEVDFVECPICNQSLPREESLIQSHVELCLVQQEQKAMNQKSTQKSSTQNHDVSAIVSSSSAAISSLSSSLPSSSISSSKSKSLKSAHVTLPMSRNSPQTKIYRYTVTCPLCNNVVTGDTESEIQNHVESCLIKQESAGISTVAEDRNAASISNTSKGQSHSVLPRRRRRELKVTRIDSYVGSETDNRWIPFPRRHGKILATTSPKNETIRICPVCQEEILSVEDKGVRGQSMMNQHVEECLKMLERKEETGECEFSDRDDGLAHEGTRDDINGRVDDDMNDGSNSIENSQSSQSSLIQRYFD